MECVWRPRRPLTTRQPAKAGGSAVFPDGVSLALGPLVAAAGTVPQCLRKNRGTSSRQVPGNSANQVHGSGRARASPAAVRSIATDALDRSRVGTIQRVPTWQPRVLCQHGQLCQTTNGAQTLQNRDVCQLGHVCQQICKNSPDCGFPPPARVTPGRERAMSFDPLQTPREWPGELPVRNQENISRDKSHDDSRDRTRRRRTEGDFAKPVIRTWQPGTICHP